MPLRASLLAALLLTLSESAPAVSVADLELVTISSYDPAKPLPDVTHIRRAANGFLRNGKPINTRLLADFVSVLNRKPIHQFSFATLGITQAWLEDNAIPAARSAASDFDHWDDNVQALFFNAFRSLSAASSCFSDFPEYFDEDSNLRFRIHARFRGGRTITWTTRSSAVYLLPWLSPSGEPNFDLDLSRSVSKLLPAPPDGVFFQLDGDDLLFRLANCSLHDTEKSRRHLTLRNQFPSVLTRLDEAFLVDSFALDPSRKIFYNFGVFARQDESLSSLTIKARFPNDPPGLHFHAALEMQNARFPAIADLLNHAPQASSRLRANPRLMSILEQNKNASIALTSFNGQSFHTDLASKFVADMQHLGKQWLVDQLPADPDSILHFQLTLPPTRSDWLLLPNNSLILWRSRGAETLPFLATPQIPAGQCKWLDDYDPFCVGWLFDATGRLDPRSTIQKHETCFNSWRKEQGPIALTMPLYRIWSNESNSLMTSSGAAVLPFCFEDIAPFSEGMAVFQADGRYGVLDASAHIRIPPTFDLLNKFQEGVATFIRNGKVGFVDQHGNQTILGQLDGLDEPTMQYQYWELRLSFIDNEGNVLKLGRSLQLGSFIKGLVVIRGSNINALLDRQGKLVLTAPTPIPGGPCAIFKSREAIHVLRDPGLFKLCESRERQPDIWRSAQRNGKWFYLDATNKVQLGPLDYEHVSDFAGELAMVRPYNGTWVYINRQGTLVWPKPQADSPK